MELKLSAYYNRVCLNSTLDLSLEITNSGREQIRIYKPGLWSQFSYEDAGRKLAGSSIACGPGGDGPENWIVLEPGERHFDTMNYRLEWNSFFQAAGSYKLSTSVSLNVAGKDSQTAHTNFVEFETYDCAAK